MSVTFTTERTCGSAKPRRTSAATTKQPRRRRETRDMPNHVTTICTVTGAADDLQAFATWFAEGFSFERIGWQSESRQALRMRQAQKEPKPC